MWPRDQQRAAQALDRYLQGDRVTTIAADLHLSPSTVRRWINEQLRQIAHEENTARVERLRPPSKPSAPPPAKPGPPTTKQARLEDLTPEHALHRPYVRAHTYLRLALIAQREVARLQVSTPTQTRPPTPSASPSRNAPPVPRTTLPPRPRPLRLPHHQRPFPTNLGPPPPRIPRNPKPSRPVSRLRRAQRRPPYPPLVGEGGPKGRVRSRRMRSRRMRSRG